ncbi:ABC transporter substrate-binding protein [Specibacter sp. RAF43]|uniref:ABC transporter substrate-binding protein n=1 Tax=Specibacter sp. RAF43 TaxID=3233057 RepID=UPI003F9E61EA
MTWQPTLKRWSFATVLAVLLMAVTACSPGSSSSVDTEEKATLRFVYSHAPATLDPATSNSAYYDVPLFLMFDRLIHISPEGKPVPGLAESWTYSKDGKTLSLKLRDGVKFHDGTQFNSDAVKANIEYGLTVKASFVKTDLQSISNVKVVDPLRVDLELKETDVALVAKLSGRAGAIASPASIERGDLGTKPVGTGMYQIDGDYQVGVKLDVKQFDGYWDPKAQMLAGVSMSFNTDPTAALNAIRSSTVDAGYLRDSTIDPAKSAGLNIVEGYGVGFGAIVINQQLNKPLQDPRVVKAINLAINREDIVSSILFGYGKPANQPFPEGSAGRSDAPAYSHDPAEAKKLLAAAGYANGFDLTLTNAPGPNQRVSEAVAAQLEKVGIRVKVKNLEGAALAQGLSTTKNLEAVTTVWTGRADPSLTLEQMFLPTGITNPGGKASEKLVSLYQQQRNELDPAKRAELLAQISTEIVENPGSPIILFQSVNAVASAKKVTGLQTWQSGKLEFRGVGLTK